MTVIVNDTGFHADDWTQGYCGTTAANDSVALDLPSDTQPEDVALTPTLQMIRVDFPSSADGRG
ncbi:MAG: oxidoreductase, partial [Sulfitobacter sp.]